MSWPHRRHVLALTLVLGIALGTPALAAHDPDHSCDGDANIGGGGGEARGECESSAGSGGSSECDPESTAIAYYDDPPEDQHDQYLLIYLRSPPPEGMHYAAAYNCAGVHLGGPHLVPDPDWTDIRGARDAAQAIVTPALPEPQVSPGEAVVNFPTWLWVEDAYWQPASATASQGAVTVRVEARPVKVTWNLDEGTQVCDGPGIPWSDDAQQDYEAQPVGVRGRGNPACTFTFAHSSSVRDDGLYHATVTVTWEFAWWLNGIAQGVFGTVESTTPFDLKVGEIQALITDY